MESEKVKVMYRCRLCKSTFHSLCIPHRAARIVVQDLCERETTVVIDEDGRALRPDGSVIDGLYAAGNTSAPVMGHTYAGPGATIGPAIGVTSSAASMQACGWRRPRSASAAATSASSLRSALHASWSSRSSPAR